MISRNALKIILVGLVALGFWRWIYPFSILTHADWGYYFGESQRELLQTISIWRNSGLGAVDVTVSSYPLRVMWGVASLIMNFGLSERFIFMLPSLIIYCYGGYVLGKRVFGGSEIAGYITSLFIIFNSYTLMLASGHLNLFGAFAWSIPFLYASFKAFETRSFKSIAILALLSFMVGIYDFRVLYILLWVVFFYAIYYLYSSGHFKKRSVILRIFMLGAVYGFLLLLINAFWLPGLVGLGQVGGNEFFDRTLFGSEFLNINNSIALYHPFWTGGEPSIFTVQSIPVYAYLLPIVVSLSLYFNRKNKTAVFFGLLALMGILLTKQSADPFPGLYLWLYNNLPGFNAFREASKFFFLIAISYAVLLGGFIKKIDDRFKAYKYYNSYLIIGFISVLIFVPMSKPLIDGSFKTLFVAKEVPDDYVKLKELIKSQDQFFRTYWLPTESRWSYYDDLHPKISATGSSSAWSEFYENKSGVPIKNKLINELKNTLSDHLLNSASVKYVVIPLRDFQNNDDFYQYYGSDRTMFELAIKELRYLQRVDVDFTDILVYENLNFKEYFASTADLYSLNFPDAHEAQKIFKNDPIEAPFTIDGSENATQITGIGKLERSITSGNASYEDANGNGLLKYTNYHKSVSILPEDDEIAFSYSGLSISGELSNVYLAPKSTNLVKIKTPNNLVMETASGLQKIDIKRNSIVGISGESIKAYEADATPVLNETFDDTEVKYAISNCNKFDDSPLISAEKETSSDGILTMSVRRHLGCIVFADIDVLSQSEYMLSFDYLHKNNLTIGYEVQFNDSDSQRVEINNSPDAWRTLTGKIDVPANANKMTIRLLAYPNEDNKGEGITKINNVKIEKINKVLNEDIATISTEYPFSEKLEISYRDPALSGENLFVNPSLEDGLWREEVGDCNAYDNYPKLGMSLAKDASNGKQALQLEATRHIACTGPPETMPVIEGKTYLLEFDYQSDNASQAGFYMSFDDPQKNSISEQILITNKDWNSYSKMITIPYGTGKVNFTVYSYASQLGDQNIITRYDNFSLKEVPNLEDQFYLVSEPKVETAEPKDVLFSLDSPTKKTVQIKGATKGFYLAMSESYHPKWRATFNNSKYTGLASWTPFGSVDSIADKYHYELNGWQNGWFINVPELCAQQALCKQNANGSYDIDLVVEFTPQRWFYVGGIISATTFVAVVGYLLYGAIVSRRNKPLAGGSVGPDGQALAQQPAIASGGSGNFEAYTGPQQQSGVDWVEPGEWDVNEPADVQNEADVHGMPAQNADYAPGSSASGQLDGASNQYRPAILNAAPQRVHGVDKVDTLRKVAGVPVGQARTRSSARPGQAAGRRIGGGPGSNGLVQ